MSAPHEPHALPEHSGASHPKPAHQCICDGCTKRHFEGRHYRCIVCDNYNLCKRCYKKNVYHLSHGFMWIDRPDSLAIVLAPCTSPQTTPASPMHCLPQPTPATQNPKPTPTQKHSQTSANTGSFYFYNDMTVSQADKIP